MLTRGIPPEFRGGVHLWNHQTPSGHATAYRWRSLPRVRRHRASKPQGSYERVLPWQVTMNQLICAFLSHPHYWYEVGMLKVPACTTKSRLEMNHRCQTVLRLLWVGCVRGRRARGSLFQSVTVPQLASAVLCRTPWGGVSIHGAWGLDRGYRKVIQRGAICYSTEALVCEGLRNMPYAPENSPAFGFRVGPIFGSNFERRWLRGMDDTLFV